MTDTSFDREGGRRQTIDVNKAFPILIPVPDESPSLPVNTDGKEFVKHHREFNAVKGLRKVHRLQLFADSFRDHQVKCVSHTPAIPLIMHLDYAEFTQTLIHVNTDKD